MHSCHSTSAMTWPFPPSLGRLTSGCQFYSLSCAPIPVVVTVFQYKVSLHDNICNECLSAFLRGKHLNELVSVVWLYKAKAAKKMKKVLEWWRVLRFEIGFNSSGNKFSSLDCLPRKLQAEINAFSWLQF